jgi:hypothetical protein
VVTDVMQSIPPLVDSQEVAQKVVEAVTESPLIPDPIDAHKLAQEIASLLPAPQPVECDSCRTARVYERTISMQSRIIIAMGGAVGLLVVFLMCLLFIK